MLTQPAGGTRADNDRLAADDGRDPVLPLLQADLERCQGIEAVSELVAEIEAKERFEVQLSEAHAESDGDAYRTNAPARMNVMLTRKKEWGQAIVVSVIATAFSGAAATLMGKLMMVQAADFVPELQDMWADIGTSVQIVAGILMVLLPLLGLYVVLLQLASRRVVQLRDGGLTVGYKPIPYRTRHLSPTQIQRLIVSLFEVSSDRRSSGTSTRADLVAITSNDKEVIVITKERPDEVNLLAALLMRSLRSWAFAGELNLERKKWWK